MLIFFIHVWYKTIDTIPTTVEQEFLDWQRQYDSYRRKKALEKIERAMMEASLNDCQEKFIAGRIAYGGEFKPQFIAHEIEIQQEALDTQNYSDMEEYLIWKSDPKLFDESASQYLQ